MVILEGECREGCDCFRGSTELTGASLKIGFFSKSAGSHPGTFFELPDEMIYFGVSYFGSNGTDRQLRRSEQQFSLFQLGIDYIRHTGDTESFFVGNLEVGRG